MNNKKLPLPQRYINKKDAATLKTIEIIGREKYAQLLDNNLIVVDYGTLTINQRNHREHISRLNRIIEKHSNYEGEYMSDKIKNDEKQLTNYLKQIEAAALMIVSNPSTKHINKKLTKWAMKVSSKAFIAQHRIDLQ